MAAVLTSSRALMILWALAIIATTAAVVAMVLVVRDNDSQIRNLKIERIQGRFSSCEAIKGLVLYTVQSDRMELRNAQLFIHDHSHFGDCRVYARVNGQ